MTLVLQAPSMRSEVLIKIMIDFKANLHISQQLFHANVLITTGFEHLVSSGQRRHLLDHLPSKYASIK